MGFKRDAIKLFGYLAQVAAPLASELLATLEQDYLVLHVGQYM